MDLSIDFIMGLQVSTEWKSESYNLILVIIDHLTKIVYYKLIQITIDIPGLAEVIINVIICHHQVSESIITDCSSLFILKFWSLLYYFLGTKKSYLQLFTHKRMARPKGKIVQ